MRVSTEGGSKSRGTNGGTPRGALRAATAAVAVMTLGLTGAVSAHATQSAGPQATSGFLSGTDLPPHETSPWFEGDITNGLPHLPIFCVTGVDLPEEATTHREFSTEVDAGALQLNVAAQDEETAAELAGQLRDSVANCAADWLRDNPGGTASWRDLGSQDVGDGAHTYGVHINSEQGAQDVHLFGVGREGNTVTLVQWGQMGTFDHAPLTAFRDTVTTAVDRLHD